MGIVIAHSGIKDTALPYVFDVLSDICGAMEDSL